MPRREDEWGPHYNYGFNSYGEGHSYRANVASVAYPKEIRGRYIAEGSDIPSRSSDSNLPSELGKDYVRDDRTRWRWCVILCMITLFLLVVVCGLVGLIVGLLLTQSDTQSLVTTTTTGSTDRMQTTTTTEAITGVTQKMTEVVVNLQVTLNDREFTEELRDNTSVMYMEAVEEFSGTIDAQYANNPNYVGVEVKEIRQGSWRFFFVLLWLFSNFDEAVIVINQELNEVTIALGTISNAVGPVEVTTGFCENEPCFNGATCVDSEDNTNFTCTCAPGYTDRTCETDIDECVGVTCANGGTCQDGINQFTCDCVPGYQGTLCDTDEDECQNDPCRNQGTCINTEGSFSCNCSTTGFQGPLCETDVDECTADPCQNGGTCQNEEGSYTCNCIDGWEGTNCETDTDECQTIPCQNSGICVNNDGTFTCICTQTGFDGPLCENDVNECTPVNPCMNGATCQNRDGSYECTCTASYDGTHCTEDVNECTTADPCLNGATCQNEEGFYTCNCTDGWEGMNCETDTNECLDTPCQNQGTCTNTDGSFTCACTEFYQGPLCTTDVNECTTADPCLNGATCQNEEGSYTCNCTDGWEGQDCETDTNECEENPCENQGTCTNIDGSYTCQCTEFYQGSTCNIDVNECFTADPCLNGATCQNEDGSYNCNCIDGWEGQDCETDTNECSENPCQNQGTCTNIDGSYTCNCTVFYQGPTCESDINECTTADPCQNGATCQNEEGSYTCNCTDGWEGTNCETDTNECEENPCQNLGTCTNIVGSYTCNCTVFYQGLLCERDVNECTTADPCLNGATCQNEDGSYTCNCTDGWEGQDCETDIDECGNNPCENGGTCINTEGSYSCNCTAGYVGFLCNLDACDQSDPCINGATCSIQNGTTHCVCANGFEGDICESEINECDDVSCKNNGICHDLVGDFNCTCMPGYTGRHCELETIECEVGLCVNGGTCEDLVNAFRCMCPPGFSGMHCENDIDDCAQVECENGATCDDLVNDFFCDCPLGFNGTYCENDIDDCSQVDCQNGATCNDLVNDFSCDCVSGFNGTYCENNIDDCVDAECMNGGICIDLVNEYSCSCPSDFTGPSCIEFIGAVADPCESLTCENEGRCQTNGTEAFCTCADNFIGDRCERGANTLAILIKMHGKYGPEFLQEGTPENTEMRDNVTRAVNAIVGHDSGYTGLVINGISLGSLIVHGELEFGSHSGSNLLYLLKSAIDNHDSFISMQVFSVTLDIECGYRPASSSTSQRIIGGTLTQLGDWPWMISLRDADNVHRCGGVVMSKTHGLTAAHCVGKFETAVFGDLKQSTTSPYHVSRKVQAFSHQSYDSETIDNDIAVIVFETPLDFDNDFIKPICLSDLEDPTVYPTCYVSGWGHTSEGGHVSDTLQEATVQVFSQEECENFYHDREITSGMICAGHLSGEMDTCQGDTGGPLQCEDDEGRMHLVGITSFGYGCGRRNFPGVYARVSEYLKFIETGNVEDDVQDSINQLYGPLISLEAFNQESSQQIWVINSTQGSAVDIIMHAVDIERAYHSLLIGYGDDPGNEESIIASSDTAIEHFYRVYDQTVWFKYTTDDLGFLSDGFNATIMASASGSPQVSCTSQPCGPSNLCNDNSLGYSCTCLQESSSPPCDAFDWYGQLGFAGIDCDFEDGLCGWAQVRTPRDIFDWTLRSGSTASSSTGPDYDHTLQNEDGTYIYIETSSPRSEDDFARLISPMISPPSDDKMSHCFNFFYHMYGATTGTLNVNFLESGSLEVRNLWTRSGDLGDIWLEDQVSLHSLGPGWLIFEGIDGDGFQSDIAIDDLSLFECEVSTYTPVLISAGNSSIIEASGEGAPEKFWNITTPNGNTLDIFVAYLDLKRFFSRLTIGFGDDPEDDSSIFADSDMYIAHFYRIHGQSVWIKFVSDGRMDVDLGFSVTVQAKDLSDEYTCADEPCGNLSICTDVSSGYSCICSEQTASLPCSSYALEIAARLIDVSPDIHCDFEDGLCGWEQVNPPHDYADWDWYQQQDDSYIQFQAFGSGPGISASLISPKLTRTGDGSDEPLCFTFSYRLYGGLGQGALQVSFIPEDTRVKQVLWSNMAWNYSEWRLGEVDLSSLGTGWLVLDANSGEEFLAEIQVDHVSLSSCQTSADLEGDIVLQPDRVFFLLSPNFPESYPNQLQQTWLVIAPEGDGTRFVFDFLRIEPDFDVLSVGTGHDPSDAESTLHSVSGYGTSKPILTVDSLSWVKFETDFTIRNVGFIVAIHAISDFSEYFICNGSSYIIPLTRQCNGVSDCPDGSDEATCESGEGLLFVADLNYDTIQVAAFSEFDIFSLDFTTLPLSITSSPIAVDFDPSIGTVFWSENDYIKRGDLDGSNQLTLDSSTSVPDGLALDLIDQRVYWTDTGTNEINSVSYDGTSRQTIINTALDEPRAIVIHQLLRVMFWTDWGSQPKIERATLTGANRQIIVESGLVWPNGLSFNKQGTLLYWIEASLDLLEVVDLSGGNRRTILSMDVDHPFDLVVFGTNIVWTDWDYGALGYSTTMEGFNGTLNGLYQGVFSRPAGIHMVQGSTFGFTPPPTSSGLYPMRLLGGSSSQEGRVEIFYNGAWGTVCDDFWDDYDAQVVCRQLGFPTDSAVAWENTNAYGQGTGPILLDDVDCTGSELSLDLCHHNGWYNHDCSHYEDAGVRCGTIRSSTTSTPTGNSTFGPIGNGSCVSSCCLYPGAPCYVGGCWCDDACINLGDCCSDYLAVCPAPAPGNTTTEFPAFTGTPSYSEDYVNLTIGETQTFSSPNFPSNYPNDVIHTWYITIPMNYSLFIRFTAFNLEQSYDYLVFGSGHSSGSGELRRFTGNQIPRGFRLNEAESWMQFTSDSIITDQGFQLELSVIDISLGCSNGSFRCANYDCIPNALTCDGYNDCGDFSDEEYCPMCVPVVDLCQQLPYSETYFPNEFSGNTSQAIGLYLSILSTVSGCHPNVNDLACNMLFPECIHHGPTQRLCYSTCQNITEDCRDMFEMMTGLPWPVDCEEFAHTEPLTNGYCEGAKGDVSGSGICGTRPAYGPDIAEVIGGIDAMEGEFPWMVSLHIDNDHLCGGVLIDSEWVVTAAHCVDGYTIDQLILGHTSQSNLSDHHMRILPSDVVSYPHYQSSIYDGDVALLRLSQPVNFTDYIRPACLGESTEETTVYSRCLVSGWGRTEFDGYSDILQKAVVGLFDNSRCEELYGTGRITENMICAGYERGQIDTCSGDSGGPLACEGEDGRWHLVGITSWGDGCAQPGNPGVYSRISTLLPWIQGVLEGNYSVTPTLLPTQGTGSCASSCCIYPDLPCNGGGCWCDTGCISLGDCCSDYYTVCQALGNTTTDAPGGSIYLDHDGSGEIITSPNYPSDYPNYAYEQWQFIAPPDSAITVHFNDFRLESCCDYVTIYSGNTPEFGSSQQIAEFLGFTVPDDVVGFGSYLWIRFTSDYSVTYRGFSATITAFNASGLNFCAGSAMVLLEEDVCNGIYDCRDYSDEVACDYDVNYIAEDESFNISHPWISNSSFHAYLFSTDPSIAFRVIFHDFYLYEGKTVIIGTGHVPLANGTVVRYISDDSTELFDNVYVSSNESWIVVIGPRYWGTSPVNLEVMALDISDFFLCQSGDLYPADSECDITVDCLTGEDERDCDLQLSQGNVIQLQSHNYPNYYPNNAFVRWVITMDQASDQEQLHFYINIRRLYLASYDYLYAIGIDGETNATTNIFYYGYYSYFRDSESYLANDTSIVIEFSSDYYYQDRGFDLDVSVLDVSDYFSCSDGQLLNRTVECDFVRDCTDGSDENGCERNLLEGESLNVTSAYTYRNDFGYILWRLSTSPDLAFLIDMAYSYIDYGSSLAIGTGHDPRDSSSTVVNITYDDGGYNFYNPYSQTTGNHLLNSSEIFIEYQYRSYSDNAFLFEVTAVQAEDYMYCGSEPNTAVYATADGCNGIPNCINANDENTCDPLEVSLRDVLNLRSYGYPYRTQSAPVTWSLVATDDTHLLLRFLALIIAPNATLCVGEGGDPLHITSTVTCITQFLSVYYYGGYITFERLDIYASVLIPPGSGGLWVSFQPGGSQPYEYHGNAFDIAISAISSPDDFQPCGNETRLVHHVNQTCDGAAQCPGREDEALCAPVTVALNGNSENITSLTLDREGYPINTMPNLQMTWTIQADTGVLIFIFEHYFLHEFMFGHYMAMDLLQIGEGTLPGNDAIFSISRGYFDGYHDYQVVQTTTSDGWIFFKTGDIVGSFFSLVVQNANISDEFCDFEYGSFCSWNQASNDTESLSWIITSGEHSYYGSPEIDHTLGTSAGHYALLSSYGHYYYNTNSRIALQREITREDPLVNECLSFWYVISGHQNLNIIYKVPEGLGSGPEAFLLWTKERPQYELYNDWTYVEISLFGLPTGLAIMDGLILDDYYSGYIAVDDISLGPCITNSTLVIEPDSLPQSIVLRGNQMQDINVRTHPGYGLKFEVTNSSTVYPPFEIVPGFVADQTPYSYQNITYGSGDWGTNVTSITLASQFAVIYPNFRSFDFYHDRFAVIEISAVLIGDSLICSHYLLLVADEELCDGYYVCPLYDDETHSTCEPRETRFLAEGESTLVTSQNYPSAVPNSLFWTAIIRTNSSGFRITPYDVVLGYGDILSIGPGANPILGTNPTVEISSGNHTNSSFVIVSQEMWIRFVSSSNGQGYVEPWYEDFWYTRFAFEVESIDTTGLFVCSSGISLDISARCDSFDDCYDGSDENGCEYPLSVGDSYWLDYYNGYYDFTQHDKLWLFSIDTDPSDMDTYAFFIHISDIYVVGGSILRIGSGFTASNDSEYHFVNDDYYSNGARRLIQASEMHVEITRLNHYTYTYFHLTISPDSLEGLFICDDGFYAVNQSSVCDVSVDCLDGSDESGCVHTLSVGNSVTIFSPGFPSSYALWLFNLSSSGVADTGEVGFIVRFHFVYLSYGESLHIGAGLVPNNDSGVFTGDFYQEERLLVGSEMFIAYRTYPYYSNTFFHIEIQVGEFTDPFICGNGPFVVNQSNVCDLIPDCTDGSDELSCIHDLFAGDSLQVFSPNYPNNYPGNTGITWLFQGNPSTDSNLTFVVSIEYMQLDDRDTLRIGQGHDATGFPTVNFTGYYHLYDQRVTHIQSDRIFIEFVSDEYYNYGGFLINVQLFSGDIFICNDGSATLNESSICDYTPHCTDGSDESECIFKLSRDSYMIALASQNYPDYYPPNAYVRWNFQSTTGQDIISQLSFGYIYLGSGDSLVIRHSYGSSNFSGQTLASFGSYYSGYPDDLLIRGGDFFVEFDANSYSQRQGFRIEVDVLDASDIFICNDGSAAFNGSSECDYTPHCTDGSDESECIFDLSLGSYIQLASHSYPYYYPPNAYVRWNFQSAMEEGIVSQLSFGYIYLGSGDSLLVARSYGSSNFSGQTLASFGSYYSGYPSDLLIRGGDFFVEFDANWYSQRQGFRIELNTWNASDILICSDGSATYNESSICDYTPHCTDGSDESECIFDLSVGSYIQLASHNYPSYYPPNAYVRWNFQSTTGEDIISQLSFGYVYFGSGDSLLVARSNGSANFSGQTLASFGSYYSGYPDDLLIRGGDFFVEFDANSYSERQGFRIELNTWNASDILICNDDSATYDENAECDYTPHCTDGSDELECISDLSLGSYIQLASHNYPSYYPPNAYVRWNFQSATGEDIISQLSFGYISIGYGDSLVIRRSYGSSNFSGQTLASFGSYYSGYPDDLLIRGGDFYVEFYANSYTQRQGFRIELNVLDESGIFDCGDGTVILNRTCDYTPDCVNGADEMNCNYTLGIGMDITLSSHNYPNYYPDDAYVLWLIQYEGDLDNTDVVYIINFGYIRIDYNDYLTVGYGSDPEDLSSVVVSYGDYYSGTPDYLSLTAGDIYIVFEADDYAVWQGFRLQIGVWNIRDDFLCYDDGIISRINQTQVCDGKMDCKDGRDERNCSITLSPYGKVLLASYQYPYYPYVSGGSYSSWRVSAGDSSNALVVKVESFQLYYGGALTIHNSGAANGREITWSFEDFLYFSWSSLPDKVFLGGDLLIEFHSLYEGGFGLQVLELPLEDISTCDGGDKILPPGGECDGTVDCSDSSDELGCLHQAVTLSLGESEIVVSPDYPGYISTTRPVMLTWLFTADDGSRLLLDVLRLQISYEDTITFGTGLDPQDSSTIVHEYSRTSFYDYSGRIVPDISLPGSEFWVTYMRDEGFFLSTAFSFEVTAVQESTVQCPPGQDRCGDFTLECINSTHICDGVPDCFDGADELCECPSVWEVRCGPTNACVNRIEFCYRYHSCETDCTFACDNGEYIHQGFVCDGFNDCGDHTDERQNCECADHQFDCGERCIHDNQVCDGFYDCADSSDEANCTCQSFEFECANRECQPYWKLCDGQDDCGDNSDEITENCRYCPGNYFQCHDFTGCLSRDEVCNGYGQCNDGSDEFGCDYPSSPDTDEDFVLNSTIGCHALYSPSYPYYYNNIDYTWQITAADGDTGFGMKFDVFSLETGFDYLLIGVGQYDGNYLYRLTGTYTIELRSATESDVGASKGDLTERAGQFGRKKRSANDEDFCSNPATYNGPQQFPYVIRLNTTQIWLRMTTDSSVTSEGFVMQLISTQFGSEFFECSDSSIIPANKTCDLVRDCPSGEDEEDCYYDIELSSPVPYNLTSSLTDPITSTTLDAVWRISNTLGFTGYQIHVLGFFSYGGSSLDIGLGSDASVDESLAITLSPYPQAFEVLIKSDTVWIRLHKGAYTFSTFSLQIMPTQLTEDDEFLCSNGLVNVSSNVVCDEVRQCADGNDEENCYSASVPVGCGLRPALDLHRITNGMDVSILGEAPWQVALYGSFDRFTCGGSVIAEEWILTAAHCVDSYEYSYRIQAGTLSYRTDGDGQFRDVSQIFIHPMYDYGTLDNDIALLKLSSPLNFTNAVQPVCLPPSGDHLPEVGSYVSFTGWGSFGERHGPLPDVLQKARQPVIPNDICRRQIPWPVTPSMFCVMFDTGYQSACTGDSGGPLVQKEDGRWTIYGVTSWGGTCGEAYTPSGKTRVSSHLGFIYETISEN